MWWRFGAGAASRCVSGSFVSTKKLLKLDAPRHGVKGWSRSSPVRRITNVLHNSRQDTIFRYPTYLRGADAESSGQASMSDSERLSKLRHDLSNPLSALLAETQLLLLNEAQIDAETVTSLREIEALAIRMRTMLREL
jgi:signal transduction histidine kinase